MNQSTTLTKPAALQLADQFFDAIEINDMDTVSAIYAPDAMIWHNFDPLEARMDKKLSCNFQEQILNQFI